MISFDKNEKFISDALDALDPELPIPDLMSGIRKKLDSGTANAKTRRKPMRFLIVAAALVAVLGITAAAASLGGFDWLLKKANPPFGDVVKPIEQSTISQGVKVTAVAAESSGDMAILYVTLEDTQHLGRVTEDTGIDFASTQGVQRMSADQIYFDKETGIAAYQIRLGSPGTFDGQSLLLQMNGLLYGGTDLGEIRMNIDLAKAVAQGEHNGQPYSDPKQGPSEQLTPGHVADIPGTKSAWVSAIGVNHGYFAVQFAQPAGVDRSMNANRIQPYLLDAGGHIISGQGATVFTTDAQLNPIHTAKQGAYDLTEAYFAVDTEKLDGYTLCFNGSVWNAISGEWNLNVNFDSLQHQAREVKADITVGKVQLKDVVIKINPFGMTMTGNYAPDVPNAAPYAVPMSAKTVLETTKGDIELKGETFGRTSPTSPFEAIWYASSAIDLDSITAVRIGDNRIELKNK